MYPSSLSAMSLGEKVGDKNKLHLRKHEDQSMKVCILTRVRGESKKSGKTQRLKNIMAENCPEMLKGSSPQIKQPTIFRQKN